MLFEDLPKLHPNNFFMTKLIIFIKKYYHKNYLKKFDKVGINLGNPLNIF